jgi:hypothetical protein
MALGTAWERDLAEEARVLALERVRESVLVRGREEV